MFYLSRSLTSFCVVSVWAAVDQGLSDRIAKAIGHPTVAPLNVKPAAEAVKFRTFLGFAKLPSGARI